MIRFIIAALALFATPLLAQTVYVSTGTTFPPAAPAISAPRVNGAIRFKFDAANWRIGPVKVDGAYRAIETDAGVDLTNGVIDGLTATNVTRDGIRIRKANGLTISNFDLRHAAAPSTGADLPEGIAITAGTNIVVRDGKASGFQWSGTGYRNGDGIATEGASSGLIDRVTASDNSDGGFDIKGTWALDSLIAERNARNYRFWHNVTAGALVSSDGGTAVWLGKGAVVTIQRLTASSSKIAQVFALEGSTTLNVVSCDLTGMAKGSVLVKSNGSGNKVTLGPGCKL
jgi:hypothetical protein